MKSGGFYDLRRIQEKYPEVLWVDKFPSGEVNLYAHYDRNGDIDSLIIDDNCIYQD